MSEQEIIVGLDLGSTKVCAIVAEVHSTGIDVVGVGSVPAKGLKKGMVVNIDSTVRAIRDAVEQAETMAGVDIKTVYAGVAGSHIQGLNQEGVVAIANREVQDEDVRRVLEQAQAIPLASDRQILHVLPQQYIVDDQDGIKEPVGMSGVRLEARAHMVTAATTSLQNLTKCAERCGLHVAEMVLQPLASSHAVLSEDEREIGAALIDIGGGTSDIILYVDGAVVHTCVIPIGGINLTNDIATGLRTPVAEAERIKVKYGCASSSLVEPEETIDVPSVGGRPPRVIPRQVLCDIIEPRVEEIFAACQHIIEGTGYADMLAAGVIITGGATLLDGMAEHAERVLGLPVRCGQPLGIGGLVDVVRSPSFSTGVGLVKYGATRTRLGESPSDLFVEQTTQSRWGSRLGQWFRDVF